MSKDVITEQVVNNEEIEGWGYEILPHESLSTKRPFARTSGTHH